ncbi:ribose 5-phosphate isomerase A [Chlamydia pecorum]|uniref:Ribose-5-phosphate isomerase A n=1 Tax=Chlamydia pecorum TaxID=85991 RepID=A0AA40PQ17_9CHLA|nr:ribose 5-phosphate isomerase A [Chlamydia pecorum]AGW38089.1 ribose-5-phosphate isomerase A [Chlamydia pecorum PV3056/3]KTF28428.1 ribose 5-phosphate isomerase A [Chlamydia pecorum]KZN27120.1 ribose 5-phosphate isomerase A [Chlamydia pecorum]KZN27781.1 ribose 5-phosphate isomerase A [Chlamydia pecorum]
MEQDPYLFSKKNLARSVLSEVSSGMVLGLGSGSTSREFIRALAGEIQNRELSIHAVASSQDSYVLAKSLGIPLENEETFLSLDLVVDGADEIDPQLRMIKGGGGAIFREKILLQSAKRRIILVDESKQVPVLGKFGVPVEIAPFGRRSVISAMESLGYRGAWRLTSSGEFFLTDNGNYIYDIRVPEMYPCPEEDLLKLLQIHGIIEVGFVIEDIEVWFGDNHGRIHKKHSGGT